MLPRDIRRIMKENEKYAQMLEYYDRTGKFPLSKIRRSFTLKESSLERLKRMKKKNRKEHV